MATVAVYPKRNETYPDAAGVPITSAGAIVDVSKYILDALKRGYLLTSDPLDIYQPDDRTGIGGPGSGASLTFNDFSSMTAFAGVRDGQSCVMLGHSSPNDGGGGVCYWDSTATDDADNGLTFGTGTGRWKRAWDGRTVHAAWFGVKADVRYLTGAVVTGGGATVTHSSLTASDAGKRVLINTPSQPIAGTASTTLNDNFVSGTGDSWSTDLADATIGNPSGKGICYINGTIYAFYVALDHQLYMLQRATSTASGLTVYKEVQLASTVLSAAAGSIVIADLPVLSGSVPMIIGTDDTAALQAALEAALALGASELVLPAGNIGISSNIGITDVHGFTIRGAGINSTVLVDLRKASVEYAYPVADSYFGALSAFECSNITFAHMSYDGSVPRIGMAHSSGGILNTSGARIGFFMRHVPGGAYVSLGAGGNCGARDEHCYADGVSPDFVARDCIINPSNGNSLNFGFGNFEGEGLLVVNNVLNSAYSTLQITSGSAIVSNNDCAQDVDIFSCGTDNVVLDIIGRTKFTNNIVRTGNTASFGVAAVSCFGAAAIANTVLDISNNVIMNIDSGWQNSDCAAISVRNFGGSAVVAGNEIHNCTAFSTGGKFVDVSGVGAAGASIVVRDNKFGAGSNMTVGVNVASSFTGSVTVRDNVYGSTVTTRVAGKFGENPSILTISTTGGDTVTPSHDLVVVTANGAVPVAFPNAVDCAGKRITVKNGSAQAGTTTVTPASSTVDGAATATLVGVNVAKSFYSDGTSWLVV